MTTSYELDSDIAEKMMAAIDKGSSDEESDGELPGIDEQKHFIMANIDVVTVQDRNGIKDIIVRGGQKHRAQLCSEGIVINLGTLPDEIINKIYILLEYKISRRNSS